MPTHIATIELSQGLPECLEHAENYNQVWGIVLRFGIPVGCVKIENHFTPVLKNQLYSEIFSQLGSLLCSLYNCDIKDLNTAIETVSTNSNIPSVYATEPELAELLPELKAQVGQKFFISIVVCTRDRPADLEKCLTSLLKLKSERHRLEIIVVDNNPNSGQTAPIVKNFPSVRYDIEPRQGVSYARNKGIQVARGDIVAYIDDDVIVSENWVDRILAPFTDSRVMCVCGLILPLELESRSQELFESYGGLGHGYQRKIFDSSFFNSRLVVPTWDMGATANVAIRKSVISQVGMFDETLGAGVPAGAIEDLYLFYRILKFGHIFYYDPAAYVWHKHRSSMQALKNQLYNYSKGQVAYQLRTLLSDGDKRVFRHILLTIPIWHFKRAILILLKRLDYPLDLLFSEIRGSLIGPFAFYKSVQLHRKLNGSKVQLTKPGKI